MWYFLKELNITYNCICQLPICGVKTVFKRLLSIVKPLPCSFQEQINALDLLSVCWEEMDDIILRPFQGRWVDVVACFCRMGRWVDSSHVLKTGFFSFLIILSKNADKIYGLPKLWKRSASYRQTPIVSDAYFFFFALVILWHRYVSYRCLPTSGQPLISVFDLCPWSHASVKQIRLLLRKSQLHCDHLHFIPDIGQSNNGEWAFASSPSRPV